LTGTSNEVEVTGAAQTIDSNVAFTLGLPNNVTIGDTLTATTEVKTDTISERTGGSGVTIDGVELKDNGITLGSGATVDTIEISITNDNTHIPTSGAVHDYTVSPTGTPVDNQLAIWTTERILEGSSDLTFDGSDLTLVGDFVVQGNVLPNDDSARELGSSSAKWSSVYADQLYLDTGDYVDTITDSIGSGSSNELATTKAVYDYVPTSATITVSRSDLDYDTAAVTNSTSETTILTDATITNNVYENGDLYRLTLVGDFAGASLTLRVRLDSTQIALSVLPEPASGTAKFKTDMVFGAADGTNTHYGSTTSIYSSGDGQTTQHDSGTTTHGSGDTITVTCEAGDATSSFNIYVQSLEKIKAA
jgi:hypothetical protein